MSFEDALNRLNSLRGVHPREAFRSMLEWLEGKSPVLHSMRVHHERVDDAPTDVRADVRRDTLHVEFKIDFTYREDG